MSISVYIARIESKGSLTFKGELQGVENTTYIAQCYFLLNACSGHKAIANIHKYKNCMWKEAKLNKVHKNLPCFTINVIRFISSEVQFSADSFLKFPH